MADGSRGNVSISNNQSTTGSYANQSGSLSIDVNGKKGPNIYGRDVFIFIIDFKGNLIPYGSRQHADLISNETYYWRNNPGMCGTPGSSDISMASGTGCAARIIEEGWVMNY